MKTKKYIEESNRQPKQFRRMKIMGKSISVPGVLIISAMLVMGALIGFIWQTYTIQIQGDIDVNGNIEEPITLFYDDVQLTGTQLTVTTMDHPVLNPGDSFTNTHHFDSTDGYRFDAVLDMTVPTGMYTDPDSLWYGVTIKAYEHGTTTPLTSFSIMPSSTYEFDLYYAVDPLFEEPVIAYPFELNMDLSIWQPTIVAHADDKTITTGDGTITVLANDEIEGGVHITSLDTTGLSPFFAVTIDTGGQTIHFSQSPGWPSPSTFTYTITSDVTGLTSTATVTVHL